MNIPPFCHYLAALLALSLIGGGPAFADASGGHMQMTSTKTTAPASPCATPSPRCAKAVTVAHDRAGNIWRLFDNGHYLYVQQRLANGHFDAARRVNPAPQPLLMGGEQRPQLAFGPNNQLYVAWSQSMHKHWTCQTQFARSLDGKHFSTPITINHNRRPTTHCYPVMKTNPKGDIFIAWLDYRNHNKATGKNGMAVYYNWSTDQGASFQSTDQEIGPQSCECCRLAIAIDRHGLPEVAFRKVYPGPIRDHALVTFKTIDQPNSPQRISHDNWHLNGCPEQGPAILRVGRTTHLMWFDKGQLHYRQRINGRLTEATKVGKKGAEHPSMAATSTTLYRAWRRYSQGAMRIWLQTSRDNGDHWSAPHVVATTKGRSDSPELVSSHNKVWLSWLTQQNGYQLKALVLPGQHS